MCIMCFSLGQGAAQIQELYKKGAESFLLFPAFMASASEPKKIFELQMLVAKGELCSPVLCCR